MRPIMMRRLAAIIAAPSHTSAAFQRQMRSTTWPTGIFTAHGMPAQKAALVWLGAAMIAASLLIMIGLISYFDAMRAVMSGERWFVISSLLGPSGYMIQDAVADAMTVEAVPRVDE